MPLAVADRRSGSTAVKARRSRRMQQRATATGESEERTHWIEERVLNRIPRRILNCAFICLSHLSLISLHLSLSLSLSIGLSLLPVLPLSDIFCEENPSHMPDLLFCGKPVK